MDHLGTRTAFYLATIFQFGWIGLAQAGIIRFDPYPFAFLLFLSSLTQLPLMSIIMVGQQMISKAADNGRYKHSSAPKPYYTPASVSRPTCAPQDLAIRHVVEHMNDCRPQQLTQRAN